MGVVYHGHGLRGIVTHHSRRAAQTAEAVAASLDLSRPRVEDVNDVSEGAYRYVPRVRWCSVKDAFYGPHFALAAYLDLASSTGYSSCMSTFGPCSAAARGCTGRKCGSRNGSTPTTTTARV